MLLQWQNSVACTLCGNENRCLSFPLLGLDLELLSPLSPVLCLMSFKSSTPKDDLSMEMEDSDRK